MDTNHGVRGGGTPPLCGVDLVTFESSSHPCTYSKPCQVWPNPLIPSAESSQSYVFKLGARVI